MRGTEIPTGETGGDTKTMAVDSGMGEEGGGGVEVEVGTAAGEWREGAWEEEVGEGGAEEVTSGGAWEGQRRGRKTGSSRSTGKRCAQCCCGYFANSTLTTRMRRLATRFSPSPTRCECTHGGTPHSGSSPSCSPRYGAPRASANTCACRIMHIADPSHPCSQPITPLVFPPSFSHSCFLSLSLSSLVIPLSFLIPLFPLPLPLPLTPLPPSPSPPSSSPSPSLSLGFSLSLKIFPPFFSFSLFSLLRSPPPSAAAPGGMPCGMMEGPAFCIEGARRRRREKAQEKTLCSNDLDSLVPPCRCTARSGKPTRASSSRLSIQTMAASTCRTTSAVFR
jgi:hypothetical protein